LLFHAQTAKFTSYFSILISASSLFYSFPLSSSLLLPTTPPHLTQPDRIRVCKCIHPSQPNQLSQAKKKQKRLHSPSQAQTWSFKEAILPPSLKYLKEMCCKFQAHLCASRLSTQHALKEKMKKGGVRSTFTKHYSSSSSSSTIDSELS
jgi:hypothetical protein